MTHAVVLPAAPAGVPVAVNEAQLGANEGAICGRNLPENGAHRTGYDTDQVRHADSLGASLIGTLADLPDRFLS
jgi:hypothetical protein